MICSTPIQVIMFMNMFSGSKFWGGGGREGESALAALAWFVWRAGCCGVHLDIFKILQATARKVQR